MSLTTRVVTPYFAVVHAACDLGNRLFSYTITPNGISYARTIIGILALDLFAQGYAITSCIILTISLYLDHIDGVWARRYNLTTRWGGYIDRTCDKILILFWVGYFTHHFVKNPLESYTWIYLVPLVLLWLVEFISLIVSIFHWWIEYTAHPHFKVSDNKAKTAGKIKMLLECIGILALMPLVHWSLTGYFSSALLISLTLGVATIMGIISLLGHIHNIENASS